MEEREGPPALGVGEHVGGSRGSQRQLGHRGLELEERLGNQQCSNSNGGGGAAETHSWGEYGGLKGG